MVNNGLKHQILTFGDKIYGQSNEIRAQMNGYGFKSLCNALVGYEGLEHYHPSVILVGGDFVDVHGYGFPLHLRRCFENATLLGLKDVPVETEHIFDKILDVDSDDLLNLSDELKETLEKLI